MMQLILFDDHSWDNLLPLTFTRPVSGLRVGILTIAEKWEKELKMIPSVLTRTYLGRKFPVQQGTRNLFINGALLPDRDLVSAVRSLQEGASLEKEGTLLATHTADLASDFKAKDYAGKGQEYGGIFHWSTIPGRSLP